MMGRTHATSGAVAFLALMPVLRSAGVEVDGVGVVVCAVTAAGAAMAADLDHHSASAARALGPITGAVARVVGLLSGGHRNGTHSLVGIGVSVLITLGVIWAGRVAVGLMLAFLAAIVLAALRVKLSQITVVHTILCLVAGVALAGLSIWSQVPTAALPWAVGIGMATHIAGDCLTEEGCPLLWPLGWRVSLLNLTTDGWVERLLIGPVLGLLSVVLIWNLTDPAVLGQQVEQVQAGLPGQLPTMLQIFGDSARTGITAIRDAWTEVWSAG